MTLAAEQQCADCPTVLRCVFRGCRNHATQETTPVPDSNPKAARAAADGKLRLELVETALTHPLAHVLAHGADKYGVRNWRTQPIEARTYVGAMRRHLDAWADGQNDDPDSGEAHLVHLAACCMVVLDAAAHGTLTDNRDYAEAKPGVEGAFKRAFNEASDKLTAEYHAGQDDLVEELAAEVLVARGSCPLGGDCPVIGGCATPCREDYDPAASDGGYTSRGTVRG